ncbi:MAG: hypothetical protein SFY68_07510 [Candidatus Sumerlaeia bacterium]|nr:hypothetical protein [Candidatus Sumerlaeia bacterium]
MSINTEKIIGEKEHNLLLNFEESMIPQNFLYAIQAYNLIFTFYNYKHYIDESNNKSSYSWISHIRQTANRLTEYSDDSEYKYFERIFPIGYDGGDETVCLFANSFSSPCVILLNETHLGVRRYPIRLIALSLEELLDRRNSEKNEYYYSYDQKLSREVFIEYLGIEWLIENNFHIALHKEF